MNDHIFWGANDEFDEAMAWVKPEHSRNQVDRAGDAARHVAADGRTRDADIGYLDIIANWRASHSYPLNTFQGLLRRHAATVDADAIVVQRLKRIDSILAKLQRFSTTELSQMQDIAGCRAVVGDLQALGTVRDRIRSARMNHKFVRQKDYIAEPKEDGYRGVHLIYRYFGKGKSEAYNKMQVEIQLRTQLQHVWATAVETVDAFTGQALKANRGNADWRQFFALMGSVTALEEKSAVVPDTPDNMVGLRRELVPLVQRLNVIDTLSAFRATVDYSGKADGHYYLLRLDPELRRLAVRKYGADQSAKANDDYVATERIAVDAGALVVLVSAGSLANLKKAYPNYFPSTGQFINLVKRALK